MHCGRSAVIRFFLRIEHSIYFMNVQALSCVDAKVSDCGCGLCRSGKVNQTQRRLTHEIHISLR